MNATPHNLGEGFDPQADDELEKFRRSHPGLSEFNRDIVWIWHAAAAVGRRLERVPVPQTEDHD